MAFVKLSRKSYVPAADKPHIVIVSKGGSAWLGGRQYTLNLLRALIANRGGKNSYDVSVLVREKGELAQYVPFRSELRECTDIEPLLDNWTLRNRARWKIKRSVLGSTNPRAEEMLLRIGATFAYPIGVAKIPSADWIPDFQYYNFPDAASAADRAERKIEAAVIVRDAQRIVLSSACVEQDCHKVFPQTVGRTAVVHFRAFADQSWFEADPLSISRKYNLPERFALISNWFVPTKNHGVVLEALAKVPAEERRSMHIVCTGELYDYRNPDFYNRLLNKIHTLGVHGQISILGIIPKADQIQLLRASTAYLQPSLHEGWNTGVEEARMFGKAIILSDIPVHREQAPPSATYFDPRDPYELAGKLRKLFNSPDVPPWSPESERNAVHAYQNLQLKFAQTFLTIGNLCEA
jgi:glycosyltransferase involved in cell wall biosynthesis